MKKGFISISVIYSFFLVFMLLLLLIISKYVNNRVTLGIYKQDIKEYYTDIYFSDYLNNKPLHDEASRYGLKRFVGITDSNVKGKCVYNTRTNETYSFDANSESCDTKYTYVEINTTKTEDWYDSAPSNSSSEQYTCESVKPSWILTWSWNDNCIYKTTSGIETSERFSLKKNCLKSIKYYCKKTTTNTEYYNTKFYDSCPSSKNGVNYDCEEYTGEFIEYTKQFANNYICLGDKKRSGACDENNLYRIIGVVSDDETGTDLEDGMIKIIKDTSVGDYSGDVNNIITQLNSDLFLSNISFSSKISDVSWHCYNSDVTPNADNELVSSNICYTNKKIGLMYATDYLLSYQNNGAPYNSWLLPNSKQFYGYYWSIDNNGTVDFDTSDVKDIRPVFYLNSKIKYKSGDGSSSSPFRIK